MRNISKSLGLALFVLPLLLAPGCMREQHESYYCDDECCYSCVAGDCMVDSCFDDTDGALPDSSTDPTDVPPGDQLPVGLCASCITDDDCPSQAACLENFDSGETFCATPCSAMACPDEFGCIGLDEESDGGPFLCVPNAGSCDDVDVNYGNHEPPADDDPSTRPTRPTDPSDDTPPPVDPREGACVLNDDCLVGETCLDGQCVVLCFADEDCAEGQACQDFACVAAPDEPEVACSVNADCADGAVCLNGLCALLCMDNSDCPEGMSCQDNSCVDPE